MVADRRVPRHAQPGGAEGLLRGRERAGMARRVVVGPEEEGIRARRRLHAVISRAAAVRRDDPSLEHGERLIEFVRLCRVDDVAGHDHGLRALSRQSPDRRVEHLRRERLLRAERRVQRRPEPVEERHSAGRFLVAHVGRDRDAHHALALAAPDVDRVTHGKVALARQPALDHHLAVRG